MSEISLGLVLESLDLPIRIALERAATLGVRAVQFDATGELSPKSLGQTARREIRTLLRSYNLRLAAVGCPLRHGIDTFENQQQRLEHIGQVMQFAYELGSQQLVLPFPAIPPEEVIDPEEPQPFLFFGKPPSRGKLLRDAVGALAGMGDKFGVTVAFEPGLDAGVTVRDFLTQYDSGSLRVAFDPANYIVNGFDPTSNLSALAHTVSHVLARDARRAGVSSGSHEVPVGQGDVDWISCVANLVALEYNGVVCLKRTTGTSRVRDVESSVAYLKRLIPNV